MARLSETLAQLAQAQRAAAARFAEQPEGEDSRLRPLESFGANPGALRALTYVPEATSDRRMPLVVVLHGCTQTATGYDRGAGWSDLADRHGFAVLYPEQKRANNPNLCFNWDAPADARRGKGEALDKLAKPLAFRRIADGAGLTAIGKANGLTERQVAACFATQGALDSVARLNASVPAEVQGTPTFYVDGTLVPKVDWAKLEPVLRGRIRPGGTSESAGINPDGPHSSTARVEPGITITQMPETQAPRPRTATSPVCSQPPRSASAVSASGG